MSRPILAALALAALAFSACRSAPPQPSFYHWKSELALSVPQQLYLEELGLERLYVRVFDVDVLEGELSPIGSLHMAQDLPKTLAIVPTVFLTKRSFEQGADMDSLAARVARRVQGQLRDFFPGHPVPEWQMDCDWTAGTREAYFAFLAALRRQMPAGTALSATIRLHQVRYPEQTGLPPVDRGMLMCYNTGDIEAAETPNSILRAADVASYLEGAPAYGLPLDVALPLFRWGLLWRNGELATLIHGLGPERLRGHAAFQAVDSTHFAVVSGTFLEGHYLYAGDTLRLEGSRPEELAATLPLLRAYLPKASRHLVFYHLDDDALKQFPYDTLRHYCRLLEP